MNIPTLRSDQTADEDSSLPLWKRSPEIAQKLSESYCNKCEGFFGKIEEGPVMFSYYPEKGKMIWWHMRGCRSFYTRKTMTNKYRLSGEMVDDTSFKRRN